MDIYYFEGAYSLLIKQPFLRSSYAYLSI